MASDEELMARAAEGDMDAFEEVVQRNQQLALNVAYRFLGDPVLAEDVAQDAFLKILSGATRYEPSARFRTYLYNVVWHLCVDLYRRKRPGPLESPHERAHPDPGPAQAVLAGELHELVRAAVHSLPPRQRMAIILKHFEDMSYEDIGRALGCSPTAVDALLVRAKRKLKDVLEDRL
ncbi:MAG: sigma-70 family RNA polymerase sigma factor [Candidatus Brocadiaceae bacterium]|nr:sigma-70 family RNA polymerase sigma factor [Candidatus Brocadiaceae bacterium]